MNRDRRPARLQAGLDIEEFEILARDGYQVSVRTYQQSGMRDLPVFVYIHGGGWVSGSLETDDGTSRLVAEKFAVVVVNVEYRLAPEHKFPVGFEDCNDVVKWCATAAGQQRLKSDLRKGFILGGTSAGANFAAGIAHIARDEGLSPPLTGVVFLDGNVIDTDVTPEKYKDRILSVDEITDGPGLNRDAVEYFAKMYGADPLDKRRSPLLYNSRAGIARKVYLAVCGWDPRRDEAILFDDLLREAGVQTKMKVYKGLPHGFWTVCPDLPLRQKFHDDLFEGVEWLLDEIACVSEWRCLRVTETP